MSNSHTVNSKKHSKQFSKGGDLVNSNSTTAPAELEFHPLEVKVYNNNFDKALKAFRALVQKERILSIYKEKQFYEKPSQKRRRKRNESKRKILEASYTKNKPSPKKRDNYSE